ncbi:MAG: NUDIX hydrolase [Bacteroidales bacterium]|nr:NUDIX hydrolase [Bacteroidales bacterium]
MSDKKGIYTYEYPRPSVTTDCVIFGYDVKEGLSVLLVERGLEPYKGCWAFPGGFLKMDETTDACARRELEEETSLALGEESGLLSQLGCFSGVDRDPRGRVITIAYYALVKKAEVKGGDDARTAGWFPIRAVPSLAFDHELILRTALKRLKEDIHFKPVGFELLPATFTMPQLQDLYESILEVHFDRRNFAGKMRKLGILETTGERPQGAARSMPVTYRFNRHRYLEMKATGFKLEF